MATKRGNWIPVVTALIKKDNQVLLGQRPPGHSLAGLWEFPGGKMELGEMPEESLKRELEEELGIDAEIGSLKLAVSHSYGDRAVLLLFFEVKFWKGEPKVKHHVALKWVTPQEIETLEIPNANRKILHRILEALK